MNTFKVASVVLILGMSSVAYAQQTGNTPSNGGTQSGTGAEPGKAGQTMNAPAAGGTPGNKPGTLMDKRANAMSPNGASAPTSTGTVKQ